ncbi:hypothetical protein GN956_G6491 [Arapaima gigas]
MTADPSQLPAPLPAAAPPERARDPPPTTETHQPSPAEAMFKKKVQKDVELDRKIEALRKKNEALMKRYQEVEEDKKRAEQEGMALQGRRGKAEDLTITISKSTNEGRVVTKKTGMGGATTPRATQEHTDGELNSFSAGRGKRRQLLVTTGGNTKASNIIDAMRGKRIVSEKRGAGQVSAPGGPKEPTTEEEGTELVRKGRPSQGSKRDTAVQVEEGRQEVLSTAVESTRLPECDPYHQDSEGSGLQVLTDLTIPTSKEEQLEYLRWKKEREQIDRERVARHKNAKGQWRRAWDVDKPETLFRDRFHRDAGRESQSRGGRNARRGNSRLYTESRGQLQRNRDKGSKSLPAVGNKAKGKERLTGRARRWDSKEEEDHTQQAADTTLEEFLEELDACGEPEAEDTPVLLESREGTAGEEAQNGVMAGEVSSMEQKAGGAGSPACGIALLNGREDRGEGSANAKPLPRRAPEKKVRFLAEVMRSPKAGTPGSQESDTAEDLHPTDASIAGAEGPVRSGGLEQELVSGPGQGTSQAGALLLREVLCSSDVSKESDTRPLSAPTANSDLEHSIPHTNSCDTRLLEDSKSSATRSPGDRTDSSCSVLSIDSHSAHKSSTDKAKENGKIV